MIANKICARPYEETVNAFYFSFMGEIIRVWKEDFYDKFSVMTWKDFARNVGEDPSAICIRTPIKENQYNQTQLAFYPDGLVTASNNKGSVVLFKHCRFDVMFEMYAQKYNDFSGEKNDR